MRSTLKRFIPIVIAATGCVAATAALSPLTPSHHAPEPLPLLTLLVGGLLLSAGERWARRRRH